MNQLTQTDLLIGSYVQVRTVDNGLSEMIVSGFNALSVQCHRPEMAYSGPYASVHPVPVTAEWLLRLGFKKVAKPTYMQYELKIGGKYYGASRWPGSKSWVLQRSSFNFCTLRGIHHLQVLIWHLEGTLLTIPAKNQVCHDQT